MNTPSDFHASSGAAPYDVDANGRVISHAQSQPPSQLVKHQTELLTQNYKLTPATLYSKLDPQWMVKDFLLQASMKIAQTIVKPNGRLIISWPPRHGKSRLATIATPIWCLENFPDREIILSTYGDSLSTDFGREVRDIFNANTHLLDERIRRDVKSVGKFMTTKGGGMLSVGLGGPITGKGADVFLIDDYIKTMAEALSKTKRDADWEWFTGTAYHRLEPGGSMIIIATRWHTDDLIGRILKNFGTTDEGGEWDFVKFHALAQENDPLGRLPGEPLFPERYDAVQLEDRRKVLGTAFFNALFQQEPDDDTTKLTNRDWLEVVDSYPSGPNITFARIWDFGGGKGKENDPSVGTLVAADHHTKQLWVLDVWRKQVSPQTLENTVKMRAETVDGENTIVIIEQEPGASGIQVVDNYRVNVLPNHKVIGAPTTTNKVTRAMPVLAACESGRVKLLKGHWNEAFLSEFDDFPNVDHDDQVDTIAIAYNTLFDSKPSRAAWGKSADRASEGPNLTSISRADPSQRSASVRVSGVTWGSKVTSKDRVQFANDRRRQNKQSTR